MDLSVIIVSFNVKDLLRQCLLSLEIAASKIACEIFVVDNNSKDLSADMVRSEFPGINLIANNVNLGFSAANNQAIRKSAGQFIVLLNPDTLVEKDTLTKCLEFMKSHPDAGALGIRMTDSDGRFLPESKRALPTLRTAFFKSFGLSYLFPRSQYFNRYYLPQIDSYETSLTEVISGAFMFIRRKALDISGLLDEDFFMYGEDIDLSYRLLHTNYKNYYFSGTAIIHFKGRSTPRKSFKDIHHFYRAMRVYVRKRAKERNHRPFILLIVCAIRLREGLAILHRLVKLTLRTQ
jgi:GT2 family glycosyltransferase